MSRDSYEASRLQHVDWEHVRLDQEMREREAEDRARGYVDIGGYNVPYHLQGLVLEHGLDPDRVCAVVDLFGSTQDFIDFVGMRDDPRRAEIEARWAAIEADEIVRDQSGLFPER